MIIIYQSNKLEYLKQALITVIINKKLSNIFYSEVMLIDNIAMMEWLYIELAKYFGISSNINFFSPFDFIWEMVHKSLWGIFPKSMISHSIMFWTFMKILSNLDSNPDLTNNCSIIQKYLLKDTNKKKCLQLSENITNLFIQYFIYRQDWLLKWQFGEKVKEINMYAQSWQAELWRLFLKEINSTKKYFCYFQCNIYKFIVNFIEKNSFNIQKLPKRIFVYGISFFPSILLKILQALGKYIDIYIFCINPCRFFLKRNFKNCIVVNDNINNALLSSWGKNFKENFHLLFQLSSVCEKDFFFKNTKKFFLLQMLQDDILNDYSGIINSKINNFKGSNSRLNIKNRLLCSNDPSLSIHVCHSIQREIEVLHNNLLTIMSDDPLLLPNEIIVMAPNIDDYVSTIRSVFDHAAIYGRNLPFTIFTSSEKDKNSVISSFLKLLKISHSRFTVEEVLEFLTTPSLAMRFNLDTEGVKLLSRWISESGICWSLDDEMFSDFIMSSTTGVQYTWKYGLDRMFLGYAIDSVCGPWNKILPYNISSNDGVMFNILSQFNQFLMKLKYWRDELKKNYLLEEWLPLIENMIHDFYVNNFNSDTESILVLLKNNWRKIIIAGMKVNYCQPVPVDILIDKLENELNKRKIKHRFFSGGIVFCNLCSIHSIPFKIVYLLGMGEDFFPKNKTLFNFNLMRNKSFIGDRNSDCYFFLESLLAARERFYVSFVGYSMNSDKKYHPSILITELIEYILCYFFYFEYKEKKILPLTIDWIYANLWNWHTRFSFELKNFLSGSKHQSFSKEWLFSFEKISKYPSNFLCSLRSEPIKIISLDKLYNFYIHPIRAWFQNRLNIYIPKRFEKSSDEPFSVDIRFQYQICRDLIDVFLNKKDINNLYQRIRCSGILPYGSFGDVFWMQQCQSMMKLSQVIDRYYLTDQYNLKITLSFNSIELTGILYSVQKNGLLRWQPRLLSMRDGLLLWLEHLVYCAMGGKGDSWMFGLNSFWHFQSLSCIEAKEYLLFLIFGYFDGMNTPLLLFSHSGGEWLRHCFDLKKRSIISNLNCQKEARRKLIMAWEGNQYTSGKFCDVYVERLIPKLNNSDIESIILATKKYFLPLMKLNVEIH